MVKRSRETTSTESAWISLDLPDDTKSVTVTAVVGKMYYTEHRKGGTGQKMQLDRFTAVVAANWTGRQDPFVMYARVPQSNDIAAVVSLARTVLEANGYSDYTLTDEANEVTVKISVTWRRDVTTGLPRMSATFTHTAAVESNAAEVIATYMNGRTLGHWTVLPRHVVIDTRKKSAIVVCTLLAAHVTCDQSIITVLDDEDENE